MAFVLAGPSNYRDNGSGHEDELPSPPRQNLPYTDDMKERPRLEIILDKETILLRGTGVDVEPARLSGHVALFLAESTSIKEITLQFRGKARLTTSSHDSMNLNPSSLIYVVCNHEWSFLEGEKKHRHTLKAGRHFFPFQLQIGGSLPSSISTSVMGGASVAYKLRAHASRPGLSHNLQAEASVSILRSFAAEALEYQQTLEIENTWPEKLMYCIMVPHKAWAAGDTLTAMMKFCPLSKGVGVLNVNTTIHETTKVFVRSGYQEQTRVVAMARHEIVGGKAVEIPESEYRTRTSTPGSSTPGTPGIPARSLSTSYFPPQSVPESSRDDGNAGTSTTSDAADDQTIEAQTDISTYITLALPLTITPSHSLDPIIVSHRIRWSILILNLDGHTSELRCSLPLNLLDHHLLEQARSFTSATRRLLIGGPAVPTVEEEDMELPSYTAHIRDRVANQFLPESATMRVTNPWVHSSISPTMRGDRSAVPSPFPRAASGTSSPMEAHLLSHLPHAPGSGDSTPLDWVNSELLLSLSAEEPPPSDSSDSNPASQGNSTSNSRRNSRASSLERSGTTSSITGINGPNETYVHSDANVSRSMQGLFKASMKPFTAMPHPLRLSSRSHSHSTLPTLSSLTHESPRHTPSPQQQPVARPLHLTDHNASVALLHRAFTEVPDYRIASRGFIGGVPPLSSMAGLPSYEEASRARTTSDIGPRPLSHSAPITPSITRS
ncbi:hypothetical protein C8J56DRAFT_440136 [Mycena floridula]|nr:hypothetical protein C8J56DRAFT_440136 [Mycena floridula]